MPRGEQGTEQGSMRMKKRSTSLVWAFNQLMNRSLQGLAYKFNRGWAKPSRIIFCVTLRCNIKCKVCSIWSMPKPEELTTEEFKKVIKQCKDWLGHYRVQLAGGETFIRKDINEIVRYASDLGVLTGVVTNGTLITRELAKEMADSGLGYVHISLDGTKPETHDEIRGIPGIYEKTMAAVDYLSEAAKGSGMTVSLATIVNRRNMHELKDLVHLAEEKDLNGVLFNPLGPTIDSDPEWYKKSDLWFDDLDEINKVLDELMEMKRGGARILNPPEHFDDMRRYFANPSMRMVDQCWVGVTNFSITCDGEMHTCFKMPSLGNVRDISPKDAWNSMKAREIRGKLKTCDIHCSPGNFVYRRNLLSEVKRFFKYG